MEHSWILLSLIAAFTLATSDALTKKALTSHNEYIIAWLRLIFSLPLLLILFLFIPVPELDKEFYTAFALSLPLELLSIILYIKALRLSPLSLTLPFLALTPVFLIFVSYILLGERVSFAGGIGILFIAAGSYTLHISKIREGIFEPLRAITRERGSVLMIGVALIYSLTSTLGKVAIQHSSPLFFGSTYFTALALFFAPIAFYKNKEKKMENKTIFSVILPGIFYSLMVVSHMIAISLAKVAYVISVKRMSLIIGVLYGYLFFKEKNIGERFIGASLMFIGFIMVVTAS
ncbi:MAG TPA: DMT family transporter [Thermodesulfovibrionales bacterium]|jgi:drug/metabolite transporter (DMT)-like permease|nr:DMT family transporter [Thermodesulfovibrionales bacterium]